MSVKRKIFKKILTHLSLIVLLTISTQMHANAQQDPYGDSNGDPNGDPDEDVPFDGGISILVAAGVGYGIKKWRDAKHTANYNDVADRKRVTQEEENASKNPN